MNFSTSDMNSFWDISAQQPDSFSALPDDDFLAFLQKQFPGAVGQNQPLSFDGPDGINPQSINSTFSQPNPSPPSSDSSPSPPSTHNESSVSRRQSSVFNAGSSESPQQQPASIDDSSLKRKAANDNGDEPHHKSQHTSAASSNGKKTVSSASARRKPGAPQKDESRLMKRKEQNRAAQRAFRERKEKHVRDLEDKVAALEAKNQLSEQENENLRDLLQRLQNENMMLKQAAFTFSAPRNTNDSNNQQSSFNNNQAFSFNFSTPGAGPSKPPMQNPSPPSTYDLNFNNLIAFDANSFVPEDDSMDMDQPFSHNANQYKTIASNPMFMSFAEPSPADSPSFMGQHQYAPMSFDSFGSDHWSSPDSGSGGGGGDALEQLFGGSFLSAGNGGVDFQALLASPPSALSPVSHASLRTPSLSSSTSSPAAGTGTHSATTPTSASPGTAAMLHAAEKCPKTKAELERKIAEEGQSSFVQTPSLSDSAGSPDSSKDAAAMADGPSCEMPFAPFLRKAAGEDGVTPFVMCRGSSFPKTAKSDKNVEVLTAWRTITSNPQFKDVDINELCSEFTNKARCDGTKVVLEPEGVHHIIETLAARQAANQRK